MHVKFSDFLYFCILNKLNCKKCKYLRYFHEFWWKIKVTLIENLLSNTSSLVELMRKFKSLRKQMKSPPLILCDLILSCLAPLYCDAIAIFCRLNKPSILCTFQWINWDWKYPQYERLWQIKQGQIKKYEL